MKYGYLFSVLIMLASCSSWKQAQSEYRYVDDGKVSILNSGSAVEFDEEIENFPIYGAFSKSVYLDDNALPSVNSVDDFCKKKGVVYRPDKWLKLDDLKILNERKEAHDDIKLEVEVFVKNGSTALIVFRGTDFEEAEDWASNFRWFTRWFSTKLDQYDEVRVLTPLLMEEIEEKVETVNEFIATGHSLGGGLAQLAGYSTHKINKVIAFDSSPVTGFYDVEGGLRRFNSQNLKIYRVYEHGEFLAYVRLAMKGLYPISKNNPDIVQVRFNLIRDESVVGQHSIKALTCSLNSALSQSDGG